MVILVTLVMLEGPVASLPALVTVTVEGQAPGSLELSGGCG